MATRRLLGYNVENISGEDIELVIRDYNGDEQTAIFESGEIIHGLTQRTVNKLKIANPGILSVVRLRPVWYEEKVNWLKEGF